MDLVPNNNPAVFAQPKVAPAIQVPLQGINFLLDAIGFHNLVEHECFIEA